MSRVTPILLAGVLFGGVLPGARAAEPDAGLARQAHDVLHRYCYECHGQTRKKPPLDVDDRAILVGTRKRPFVVPGKPDQSLLWRKVDDGAMPPPDEKQPTDAEKQLLRTWIEQGAPFPGRAARPFRGDRYVLAAIARDLRELPAAQRRSQRYFTLTNLYNDPGVSDQELRLHGAALAKLLSSLTWSRDVIVPRAVDPDQGIVYAVDLGPLGWLPDDLWGEVLARYPYGLRPEAGADAGLAELSREITRLASSDLPYVRADWFLATASRPPLYHTLLQLPDNTRDLEQLLGVDFEGDFRAGRLARAAFTGSGVSRQNRVVERQPARYGAYWKSYDFRTSTGAGNVLRLPLGPDFAANPFAPALAFKQAGGEIIFNLPNGLQGYLLVNDKGRRIDEAPADIVEDSQRTTGSGIIVNGLSCMACHRQGPIGGFRDVVRGGQALRGDARAKVEQLYAEPAVMDRLVGQDEDRFLTALTRAVGPFLPVQENRDREVRELPEPVGPAAKRYLRDLDAATVACELGLLDAAAVRELLVRNPELVQLGMGPLAEGAAIKREMWERAEGTSLYQEVARRLGRGTPVVELKGR